MGEGLLSSRGQSASYEKEYQHCQHKVCCRGVILRRKTYEVPYEPRWSPRLVPIVGVRWRRALDSHDTPESLDRFLRCHSDEGVDE
jgi:hypothetical protein